MRTKFSKAEYELLQKCYNRFPNQWAVIASDFLNHVRELDDRTREFYSSLSKEKVRARLREKIYKLQHPKKPKK